MQLVVSPRQMFPISFGFLLVAVLFMVFVKKGDVTQSPQELGEKPQVPREISP